MECVIDMKRLADIETRMLGDAGRAESSWNSMDGSAHVVGQSSDIGLLKECVHEWRLVSDSGETVCRKCGVVRPDVNYSEGFEHRVSANDLGGGIERSSQVVRDGGLGSAIPKSIGGKTSKQRVRALSAASIKGNFTEGAYRELRMVKDKFKVSDLEIKKILQESKKLVDDNEFIRLNKKYVFAALLYIERRKAGVNLDLWHMAKRMDANRNTLGQVVYKVGEKINTEGVLYSNHQLVRICNSMELPEKIKRRIYKVHDHPLLQTLRVGRKPQVVYGYVIFEVCSRMNWKTHLEMVGAHCKCASRSIRGFGKSISKEQEAELFGI